MNQGTTTVDIVEIEPNFSCEWTGDTLQRRVADDTHVELHGNLLINIYRYRIVMPNRNCAIEGSISTTNKCRGELLSLYNTIITCGSDISLYTSSDYICNIFNNWIGTWLANGYRTKNGGEVKHVDIINKLVQCGARDARYFHMKDF